MLFFYQRSLYALTIRSIIAFSFSFTRYKRVVYFSLCKVKLRCTHCWISTEIHSDMQLQTIVVDRGSNIRNKYVAHWTREFTLPHPPFHHVTTRTIYKMRDYYYIISLWLHRFPNEYDFETKNVSRYLIPGQNYPVNKMILTRSIELWMYRLAKQLVHIT